MFSILTFSLDPLIFLYKASGLKLNDLKQAINLLQFSSMLSVQFIRARFKTHENAPFITTILPENFEQGE